MASISQRVLPYSHQCLARNVCRAARRPGKTWQRGLSASYSRREDENKDESQHGSSTSSNTLEQMERATAQMDTLLRAIKATRDPGEHPQQGLPLTKDEFDVDGPMFEEEDLRKANGFWAEGEPSMGADEDYYGDDITSHGHAMMQEHRELREYARMIAWELPLLNQLAKPFEKPSEATPFRFRYTSYLGESHPASNKVVVEFSAEDLDLAPIQVSKMIKLAGPRYNPGNKLIKISCERFDTQAQNKRFLGETVHKLIEAAKDSKDTFEDVPFDFRHYKPKKKYVFPRAWVMTEERKQYLDDKRRKQLDDEDNSLNRGQLVDGPRLIEQSLPFMEAQAETVAIDGSRGRPLR